MSNDSETKKLSYFDMLVLLLSVYVLITLIIESIFHLSSEVTRLLTIVDNLICVVFLYDFTYRFIKADSKLEYMKWGWIDLLSSIPTFQYLLYGRFARVYRIIKVMRTYRSVKFIIQHLFKNRTRGTIAAVSLFTILIMIFGAISILQVEHDPNSKIKTAEDAIWWSFVTITTLGYSDKIPVTTEGRIIASVLMFTKLGLFGTFTGFIASWFIGDNKDKEK
jgi:voltage-gated potassium channel